MKHCTDLHVNLEDVFCLSIIYHIPDFWLKLLNGHDFYLWYKPSITFTIFYVFYEYKNCPNADTDLAVISIESETHSAMFNAAC